MTQSEVAARSMTPRKPIIGLSIGTVLLLVAAAVIAAIATRPTGPLTARQPLEVKPLGSAMTSDWILSPRGALVTDSKTTKIQVALTRSSSDAQTPALIGNFDGSGGGDAKVVTCSSTPMTWAVPAGKTQTIALACDAVVLPAVVEHLQYVYAGAK